MRISKRSASNNGRLPRAAFALFLVAVAAFVVSARLQTVALNLLYPNEKTFTHARVSLLAMTRTHIALTLAATALSSLAGTGLGILVTRRFALPFYPVVRRMNAFIQTFPPSAVIILAFPFLGFGWEPTLFALFLYSLFPVLGNCAVALKGVDPAILDSADGMGMTDGQRLRIVELPLALPLILAGIRHAYILNLGTATIGAVIGAGGLGTIIISGLTLRNSAFVLSGTIVVVSLAFIGERFFSFLERRLPPLGR